MKNKQKCITKELYINYTTVKKDGENYNDF